jgi:hypothetical protein
VRGLKKQSIGTVIRQGRLRIGIRMHMVTFDLSPYVGRLEK